MCPKYADSSLDCRGITAQFAPCVDHFARFNKIISIRPYLNGMGQNESNSGCSNSFVRKLSIPINWKNGYFCVVVNS